MAGGHKYNAKAMVVDGVRFASKLEHYLYNLLKSYNIEFKFQYNITLQDRFIFNGEKIRPITMIIDFYIPIDAIHYYVDTKGFFTQDAKIKYKMLKKILSEQIKGGILWDENKDVTKTMKMDELCRDEVVILKNRKECSDFALKLLAEHKLAK